MSQAFAACFPLPVALALGAVLLVLLAVTAILVSLRKPARVRAPDWVRGLEGGTPPDVDAEQAFHLGHLPTDLSAPRGRQ